MAKMERRFVVLKEEGDGGYAEVPVGPLINFQDAIRAIKQDGADRAIYQVAEFKGRPQGCRDETHERRVLNDAADTT